MKTKTLKLPSSGETWKIKQPGLAVGYRLRKALPDLASPAAGGEPDAAQGLETILRCLVYCTVEPKLWFDFRSEEEQVREPLDCPANRVELDLDEADLLYVMEALNEWREEGKDAALPFAKTETA